jgi:Peptidase family S51
VSGERRQIVAFGGGGFSMERGNTLLDDYVLGLTDSPRPRVCFLPTASGDADHNIVRFYRAFGASFCEPSHVSLFRRDCEVAGVHCVIASGAKERRHREAARYRDGRFWRVSGRSRSGSSQSVEDRPQQEPTESRRECRVHAEAEAAAKRHVWG